MFARQPFAHALDLGDAQQGGEDLQQFGCLCAGTVEPFRSDLLIALLRRLIET